MLGETELELPLAKDPIVEERDSKLKSSPSGRLPMYLPSTDILSGNEELTKAFASSDVFVEEESLVLSSEEDMENKEETNHAVVVQPVIQPASVSTPVSTPVSAPSKTAAKKGKASQTTKTAKAKKQVTPPSKPTPPGKEVMKSMMEDMMEDLKEEEEKGTMEVMEKKTASSPTKPVLAKVVTKEMPNTPVLTAVSLESNPSQPWPFSDRPALQVDTELVPPLNPDQVMNVALSLNKPLSPVSPTKQVNGTENVAACQSMDVLSNVVSRE